MIVIAQSIASSEMPCSLLVNLAMCLGPNIGLYIAGLLMMVTGAVMIFKTPKKRKRAGWVLLFVFGGVALGLSYDFAEPVHRPTAKRIQCAAQLNGIGKACYMYIGDFEGKMPPNLEILMENHDLVPRVFFCPSSSDKEGNNSYVYRGGDLDENCSGELVTAYDKKKNHHGEIRNILFMDSHVKKYTEEMFQDIIARDNEIRREMGLPEKDVVD